MDRAPGNGIGGMLAALFHLGILLVLPVLLLVAIGNGIIRWVTGWF